MTKKIINQVQEFLTYCGEDRVYQIVNVEVLLKRHPPEAVIGFLTLLREDYKKELKSLLATNKTDPKINELVAKNFRIRMAINTIKNAYKRGGESGMTDELNPDQEKAAKFKDGVCAVIAVPGSGKTRTMMERIGILVKDHGIPPEAILGLTFTQKCSR